MDREQSRGARGGGVAPAGEEQSGAAILTEMSRPRSSSACVMWEFVFWRLRAAARMYMSKTCPNVWAKGRAARSPPLPPSLSLRVNADLYFCVCAVSRLP